MSADRPADPEELVGAVLDLLGAADRVLLGVAGAPGSGKSTLAEALVGALAGRGGLAPDEVALVPMDGFHLADVQLDRLGLRDRKGAPETFDVHGYAALLERLRRDRTAPVYVPGFERDLEQPLAAARVVLPQARVVVTEGNYLLHDEGGWELVRPLLTEAWYVEAPEDLRRDRLVRRHVRFGKPPDAAREWVDRVDEPNAVLVRAGRRRADRVVVLP